MSTGLQNTFEVLKTTSNEAATRVLLPALDSPHRRIRQEALQAVLTRRALVGHREVLRRLDSLEPRDRQIVQEHHARLGPAIRDALLSEERPLRTNACQAMVWFREYDLIPVLLKVLEESSDSAAALAAGTLTQLVHLLDEERCTPAVSESRRDPQLIVRYVVHALEQAAERFANHKRREVVESLILLAGRESAALRNILRSPYHPAFLVLIDILSKSPHPAVIGLLLSFLDDGKAPSGAISVAGKRTDLEFVQSLLRKVGRKPSAAVAANLRRMESLAWVRCGSAVFAQLDDMAQHAAVQTVMASGMGRADAFATIEYLLLYGKTGGRRAAAEALDEFHGADANALALKALQDPDPRVQAHILLQLRRRGVPGALPRLVGMLDSPHAVIRSAARKTLAEFTFQRFLAAFDMLDDEVRRSTGMLVKKVDPLTIPLLQTELQSPVRTRRLRGLAIVRAIDAAESLETALLGLAKDEESVVRAETAAILASCRSAACHAALCELLDDRSPLVREAAEETFQRQTASPWLEPTPIRSFDPSDAP